MDSNRLQGDDMILLSQSFIENQFTRDAIDKTIFYKKLVSEIILVWIYVDDIIFVSINEKLS